VRLAQQEEHEQHPFFVGLLGCDISIYIQGKEGNTTTVLGIFYGIKIRLADNLP
jgi:hypothetical protein